MQAEISGLPSDHAELPPDPSSQDEAALCALRKRLDFLTAECGRLDRRLAVIESSIVFRTLRRIGTAFSTARRKLERAIRGPQSASGPDYQSWAAQREAAYPTVEEHKRRASQWSRKPVVSVLLAVRNPDRQRLKEAVASVCNQSYPHWQLHICDADLAELWVRDWIEEQRGLDPRIIPCARSEAGAIGAGHYIAWLDQDDVLHPFALHYMVERLQDARVDVVYTDEDYLDAGGRRTRPSFKPDWSPELLLSCMYWGRLVAIRAELAVRVGWFRPEFDGARDYDLALRVADDAVGVEHVARVLYHRRLPPRGRLPPPASPQARNSAIRALEDTLRRRGWEGAVQNGPALGSYFITRKLERAPRGNIVVCSRNARLLRRCLESIRERTAYGNYEVIVVQNRMGENGDLAGAVRQFGCKTVIYEGPFNFARMNNAGAQVAEGDFLLFLNDDTAPLAPDWLHYVAAHLDRPDIGVAGARLLYPSGAIQHAGVALGMMDGCGHPGRGLLDSDLFPFLGLPREVSAVTGACLGIRARLFAELGGFDETFPVSYNDIDLCLRVWRQGKRVVCDPRILLMHRESASRPGGTTLQERWNFFERWSVSPRAAIDPFFPAAFDYTNEAIQLRRENTG